MPLLARRLGEEVPTASLDDHGEWLQRLSAMARVMSAVGLVILGLVFAATALCVVFATRGAMAGNRIVIEVLHFVGAEDSYVAREFQRHFLLLGLKGASIGGAIAMALFLLVELPRPARRPDPGGSAASQPLRRRERRAERLRRLGHRRAHAGGHHRHHRADDGAADAARSRLTER